MNKSQEHGSSAFFHTAWDRFDMRSTVRRDAMLQELHRTQQHEHGYSAVQDGFYALSGLTPNGSPAGELWQRIMQYAEFADLQRQFRVDPRYATMHLAEQFGKVMRGGGDAQDAPQPAPEEQPEPEESRSEAQDEPTGTEAPQESGEGKEDASGTAGSHANDEVIEPDADAGAAALSHRTSKVVLLEPEKVRQISIASDILYSFLGGDRDENRQEVQQVLTRVDVAKIAKFFGYLKRVIGGATRHGKSSAGSLTGYRRGQWGPSVHAADMAAVALKQPLAMAKFAENALSVRTFEESKPLGKGPVILLRDESSSMRLPSHGLRSSAAALDRHGDALAFEIAMAKAMNDDGRDLISIAWSSKGIRTYTYGEKGMQGHITSFLSGNTRIEPAIEEALRLAAEYVEGADILILTDGELQMSPSIEAREEWEEQMEARLHPFRKEGGRVWCIRIAQSPSAAERMQWCDVNVAMQNLEEGEDLGAIIAGLSKTREQERPTRIRV